MLLAVQLLRSLLHRGDDCLRLAGHLLGSVLSAIARMIESNGNQPLAFIRSIPECASIFSTELFCLLHLSDVPQEWRNSFQRLQPRSVYAASIGVGFMSCKGNFCEGTIRVSELCLHLIGNILRNPQVGRDSFSLACV